MVRFIHTADWHRGAPGAHPVFYSFIRKIAKLAHKYSCKAVLVVGDIFDKPHPDQRIKDALISDLVYCQKHFPEVHFVFVVGNHDYATKDKQYHSLIYLKLINNLIEASRGPDTILSNFTVIEPGGRVKRGGMQICALENWGKFDRSTASTTAPVVLAWHGTVPGMDYSKLDKVSSNTLSATQEFQKDTGAAYIALGDIHKTLQVAERTWYPGPPVQKAYNDDSSVLLVELGGKETTVTQKKLKLPHKITLNLTYTPGKDTERSIAEFVKKKVKPGNLLKLKFELPFSIWTSIDKEYVKDALKEHCVELVMENDPIPEPHDRQSIEKVSQARSITEEVSIIVDEEDFGLDRKKLKKACLGYIP